MYVLEAYITTSICSGAIHREVFYGMIITLKKPIRPINVPFKWRLVAVLIRPGMGPR